MKDYIGPSVMALGMLAFFVGLAVYRNRLQKAPAPKKGVEVVCKTCGGTGETEQDVNLLMVEASFALWYNIHMTPNKCEICSKEKLCETAQKKYDQIMDRYKELGPKMDKAACPDCMGMGRYIQYEGYRFGRERD